MNIDQLCSFINKNYIISDNLRSVELKGYMDIVIDDINDRLQSKFPTISEWNSFVEQYNAEHNMDPDYEPLDVTVYSVIPARYLRSVVAIGAALNFFTNDEEGEQVASKYYIQYERNIANMVRDFHERVPLEFREEEGGYISNSYNGYEDREASIEGIVINNGDIYDVL